MSNMPKAISSAEMEQKDDQFDEIFQSLNKISTAEGYLLANYQGFWFRADLLKGIMSFQKHFKANDTDIILSTMPKSGTTWLKALTFSIINRSVAESPLLFSNPHQLVPFFHHLYIAGKIPDIDPIPCPRIIATHIPYRCLPSTILDSSNCRIIYVCRNQLDTFTSMWHFAHKNGFVPQQQPESRSLDGPFDLLCQGVNPYGPFWDHILGYWNASLKNPQKVLFLKYEDLKENINTSVKKMANFLGYPFSAEEEKGGVVEEITMLCSLENLKNLECNKEGETQTFDKPKHSSFFRKGEVGDWMNFIPPSMAKRLEELTKEKLGESGLTLEIHGKSIS